MHSWIGKIVLGGAVSFAFTACELPQQNFGPANQPQGQSQSAPGSNPGTNPNGSNPPTNSNPSSSTPPESTSPPSASSNLRFADIETLLQQHNCLGCHSASDKTDLVDYSSVVALSTQQIPTKVSSINKSQA